MQVLGSSNSIQSGEQAGLQGTPSVVGPDPQASEQCLLLIDVQQGFRDESFWGKPSNPAALENIVKLAGWATANQVPIVVVRHDSRLLGSPLNPIAPGNQLEPFMEGLGELEVVKSVNSAFYGTPDLESWLRSIGISTVTIAGLTTNHCCETTARMAANLGFQVNFVLDATSTFDMYGPSGNLMPGTQLMQATAASLHGEFAKVYERVEDFIRDN